MMLASGFVSGMLAAATVFLVFFGGLFAAVFGISLGGAV
jgi:hypothetical protein